jgi:hypothetical protein
MRRKIKAALDRQDIRDYFDIEFLLRQGAELNISKKQAEEMNKAANDFTERDFKVLLASLLKPEMRKYYVDNKFSYLTQTLSSRNFPQ